MNKQALGLEQFREFGNLELLAKQVVEGFITGLHKSPFHGFSVEFSEHRLYNTGESTRHIDWKLYARSEKLFIKRYEEETNLRCQLVIDHSASMYFPEEGVNKLQFSVLASAALIELLKHQRDAFGLSLFTDQVNTHIQAKSSTTQQMVLLQQLQKLMSQSPVKGRTDTIKALHEIAETIPRRSLVVLFSDMFDSHTDENGLFTALQHLRYNKHEVILFHVLDAKREIKLDYDNRPFVFVDVESGEELKLNPVQLQEQFRKSAEEYRQDIRHRCGQYRIEYIETDIQQGYRPILMQYLQKRSGMLR